MKAIFIYANGKRFTAKNVIQGSIDVDNHTDENGKVERTTVTYQQDVFVDGDVIAAALAQILPQPVERDGMPHFIETSLDAPEILYGVDVTRSFDIDATAAELLYIVCSPEDHDESTVETASRDSESGVDLGLVVIPVATLTPDMLADALIFGL